MKLNNNSLRNLDKTIKVPNFNRNDLKAGIVHIGVGNFHRAHQAWYIQQLMNQGLAKDFAIIGAGVRDFDRCQREKLLSQDCLTTLIELNPERDSVEVVGSMIDYVDIQPNNKPLIDQMAHPDIKIMSLTVTEGGYYFDPATKKFDGNHPDIISDSKNPLEPNTAFGAIIAALKLRKEAGISPFTCLSCDNLQGNGDILKQTVLGLARLINGELSDWIEKKCTFPNSMVDCIVPATSTKEIILVQEKFRIFDCVPVTHESFRQWVIQDNFCNGRPALEKVGVEFTNDVHLFEKQKIRILNGGHQIIAVPGELLGLQTISECMTHPLIGDLFRKVAREEIAPQTTPVSGRTPLEYVELIDARFSNPKIFDTVRRVAFDGSSRHTGFILPVIVDALHAGSEYRGLALSQALWARMCFGTREDGSEIEPNDPFWTDLQKVAKSAKDDPQVWLEQKHIYGDISSHRQFSDTFKHWLNCIYNKGVSAAINEYLSQK